MEKALVSVVIPTFNRAALLRRAIESARAQTYKNLEILIVDDASPDQTQKAVETFNDDRLRYIRHDRNRGGAAARNTGIRAATGKYIAFLDDDDEWEPEKTELQLKELVGYKVVTCTFSGIGREFARLESARTVELEELLQGKFTFGGTGVLMAAADVLKETMFDESLPRYQDWDLFIRIALKHKIRYLHKPLLRSNSGNHARITTSILRVPLSELEREFRMLQKHEHLFGPARYRRHMCNSLLYGISRRKDKIRLLAHVIGRYGTRNVVSAISTRVRSRLRGQGHASEQMRVRMRTPGGKTY